MSNLDVALRLRLINQLGGPAKEAKRELEGVGAAAKKLDGAKVDRLTRDLTKTKIEAKGAETSLQQAAAGAKRLGTVRVEQLSTQLRNATVHSDRLAQSLRRVRSEARPEDQGRLGGGAMPLLAGAGRMLGAVGGAYAAYRGATAVKRSFQDFAELDRRVTRLGITAEATKAQADAAIISVRNIAREYAMPVEEVLKGLEALVTQGLSLPEALGQMRAVTAAAQASGAAVDDMAKSGGALTSNLKIKVDELERSFDMIAFAGKKGQFELKDMAQYLPSLAASWSNVGQRGVDKLADLAAALEIVRKQTGTSENAFNGVRDLLSKLYSTDVQNNFKKMGVDLEGGLKKGLAAGKSFFDVVIELTEKATKGDLSKLPKLFGEIDSRQAVSALINFKEELRTLRAEIKNSSAGTIADDLARVAGDSQASIDRLANAWSAAGIAVGKFVAEATPAVGILERLARGMDGAREWFSGKDDKKEIPRVDQPAGPKSSYPGRLQSGLHDKATREALKTQVPPKSSFPGRFQSAAHAAAQAQHEREVRAAMPIRGPITPLPPPHSPIRRDALPRSLKALVPQPARNYSPLPPSVETQAQATMQGVTRAISSEGAKAIAASQSIAERIKAIYSFTVEPTISPRFGGAPAGSGNGASTRPPAPASAPAAPSPGKRAGVGGHVRMVNHFNINGASKDGRQIGSEIARQLAQLGNNSGALFDTV